MLFFLSVYKWHGDADRSFLRAGGGGKTKFRKDKIREKNQKLDENRAKRIERERAAKEESGGQREEGSAGIHPSRLARIPGLGE